MVNETMKKLILLPFIITFFFAGAVNGEELKGKIRKIFGMLGASAKNQKFGKLPPGVELIDIEGCCGLKLTPTKVEIKIDTWTTDEGLMERYKKAKEEGLGMVAAINGTFYSSRGVLGQVVSQGKLPYDIMQIPGSLSRCFISSFRDAKKKQRWFIGETSLRGRALTGGTLKEKGWFNVPKVYGFIDGLLGGGGWILRRRKDVHRESYKRQRFRFRKEDQTSRHTVIAQDNERNLYLLIFEEGQSLHQIARKLVKEEVFKTVRDAIFLDGGSSSTMILNGKYLKPPLYIIDQARFSGILVYIPEEKR